MLNLVTWDQVVTKIRMKEAVWLLPLQRGQSTSELLQDVHIPLDSRVLVANLRDDHVLLSEVYHISDKLQAVHFGTWSPDSGLHTTTGVGFSDRRSNLQESAIRVSSAQVRGPCLLPACVVYGTYRHKST
jgi:hypothetical protein